MKKLSKDDVSNIRARAQRGQRVASIAKAVGVSYHTVYDLLAGRTWGSLKRPLGFQRRLASHERDRVFALKVKHGVSNHWLASRLKVSESTVARAMRDAELILGFRIRRDYLATGSLLASCKRNGVTMEQGEQFLKAVASKSLPSRLRPEIMI